MKGSFKKEKFPIHVKYLTFVKIEWANTYCMKVELYLFSSK